MQSMRDFERLPKPDLSEAVTVQGLAATTSPSTPILMPKAVQGQDISTQPESGKDGSANAQARNLQSIADELAKIASGFGLENPLRLLQAWKNLAAYRNAITVAVIGRFKAGKSSLLNDLIGQDILPTGAVPLTGVVTRLRSGQESSLEVEFLDGSRLRAPIGQIYEYVTERENPGNQKRVRQVVVETPLLSALSPLEFVDTPGLDSALMHNTQATKEWLPKIEAALVCISSDAPLGSNDLALLAEVKQLTPRMAIVMTKADLLKPSQMEEVLSYVKGQLQQASLENVPVYFYSVLDPSKQLRNRLIAEILDPLRHGFQSVAVEIQRHKLQAALRQIWDYVRLMLAARQQTRAARESLLQRLQQTSRHLQNVKHSFGILVQQWWASSLDVVLESVASSEKHFTQLLTEQLEKKLIEWRLHGIPALIHSYHRWARGAIYEVLQDLSPQLRALYMAEVKRFQEHLERELYGILGAMSSQVREILGISISEPKLTWEVSEVGSPPVDVSMEFLLPVELFGYIIPNFLIRGAVEKSLRRKIRYEVHKNISRFAAAWRDAVRPVLESLGEQGIAFVENEARALRQAMEQQDVALDQLISLDKQLGLWASMLEQLR